MTFTDADLKRFRKDHVDHDSDMSEIWEETIKMKALLARLEAAEECIQALGPEYMSDKLVEAWRKAAGK